MSCRDCREYLSASISRLLEKTGEKRTGRDSPGTGGSVIRVNGYDKFAFASEKEYKLRDTAKTSRTNEAKQGGRCRSTPVGG